MATAPDLLFDLVERRPKVMLMIAVLYPLLSALPQEIVFRPLFFRRYNSILAPINRHALIALNAAIFSLAHLMYWSPIVMIMTFFGGLIFAWAYVTQKNFPLAVILHSVAGVVLFALGMGVYFYSGNVVRPF
jgi:membrane protease YdiL (CAAX protease family)